MSELTLPPAVAAFKRVRGRATLRLGFTICKNRALADSFNVLSGPPAGLFRGFQPRVARCAKW